MAVCFDTIYNPQEINMHSLPRRNFLKKFVLSIAGIFIIRPKLSYSAEAAVIGKKLRLRKTPLVLSTWQHGMAANDAAYKALQHGKSALDAVETGVKVSENDPNVMSVGYGGLPDRSGFVTLDASIMDCHGNAGAVAFLQGYKNPISIARRVMEKTEHILLVGQGAENFAASEGFKKQNLLTPEAETKWKLWLEKQKKSSPKVENHDTISMLAIDSDGMLAGACTTSGLAFKMHGRVGDSPIIGAGLFVDNEVGAAAATGVGEECIKICGSFLIVELMRQGRNPQDACWEALRRVKVKSGSHPNFQLAFIALNYAGEIGAACLIPGFQYALYYRGENRLIDAESLYK